MQGAGEIRLEVGLEGWPLEDMRTEREGYGVTHLCAESSAWEGQGFPVPTPWRGGGRGKCSELPLPQKEDADMWHLRK